MVLGKIKEKHCVQWVCGLSHKIKQKLLKLPHFPSQREKPELLSLCLQGGLYAEGKPALLAKSTSFKKGNKLRAVGSIVLELHFVNIICLNKYKDNIQNP